MRARTMASSVPKHTRIQIILFDLSAYLAARRKVLSLGDDALMVVDIILPAVLGLVHVRKAGIGALMTLDLASSAQLGWWSRCAVIQD